MTSIKDTDYLAVSARLHAMETHLLTPEKAERLIEAADEAEARKLLAECGYAEGLPLEEALRQRRESLYSELSSAVPEPKQLDLFRLKYDYHNIKAILKAERRGISPEGLLLSGGRYDASHLQREWQQEHRLPVSDTARHAAERAAARLRENDPQGADIILDAACYAEMRSLASQMKSPFLQGYVQQLIDAVNLRTAVRAARCGSSEVLPQALLEGGSVSPHAIMMSEPAKLSGLYGTGTFAKAAALGEAAVNGGSFTAFEKACDEAIEAYLSPARRTPFGEETVLCYLAAVENEITAIRIIMTGRRAGLPPEVIRSRLRNAA